MSISKKRLASLMAVLIGVGIPSTSHAFSPVNVGPENWPYSPHNLDEEHDAYKAFDNNVNTYWSAGNVTTGAYLQLDVKTPEIIDTIVLQEEGNNITSYRVETWDGGEWVEIFSGTTIGEKQVIDLPDIRTANIRIYVEEAIGTPALKEVEVYNKMRVLGYIHPDSFKTGDIDEKMFDVVTDINLIGFWAVDQDGNIIHREPLEDIEEAIRLTQQHIRGTDIRLWATLNPYADMGPTVMANDVARANYISQVRDILNQYDFDGIDWDYEHPDANSWPLINDTIVELKNEIAQDGKLFQLTYAPWALRGLSREAIAVIDTYNSMNYDLGYPEHASFATVEEAVRITNEQHDIPRSGHNLGLAWYGRESDNSLSDYKGDRMHVWFDYDYLVDNHGERIDPETNSLSDISYIYVGEDGNQYTTNIDVNFNGIEMNKKKVLYALEEELGGIFMWHLFADVDYNSEDSLMRACEEVLDGYKVAYFNDNIALNNWYWSSSNKYDDYDCYNAFDGDVSTAWQAADGDTNNVSLQIDFKTQVTFDTIILQEEGNNIENYAVQKWDGTGWVDIHSGKDIGIYKTIQLSSPVREVGNIRLLIESASDAPRIAEFSVYNSDN